MTKIRFVTIALLVIFGAIIMLPPIIHGYIYPTAGDDSANHLQVIDVVSRGETINFMYLGQAFAAYPISLLNRWFGLNIDVLFLWFNYLALIAVGIVLYFVVLKLVNRWAAALVIPLVVFCTPSILKLFYCGCIFNIINVYVILPLAIFFMVRWITERRTYQAVVSLGLFSLFSVFHPTSLYLPFAIGLFFVAYSLLKRNIRFVGFGVGIISLSLILSLFTWPGLLASLWNVTSFQFSALAGSFPTYGLGFTTSAVLCLSVTSLIIYRKRLTVTYSSKLFIVVLSCFAIVLIPTSFIRPLGFAYRQALDLSSVLAIMTACLAGVAITIDKTKLFTYICIALIIGGSVPHLINWFNYNSAMRSIDTQVIKYLNEQEGGSYSCSTQIAPHIYDRFLKKDYTSIEGDFVVYRNEPMTVRTNSESDFFQYERKSELTDYTRDTQLTLMKKFVDEEVEIYVFFQLRFPKHFERGY